jgi:hypothetical protein
MSAAGPNNQTTRSSSSCRPRAALFGAQRRRPRLKGRDVAAAALWWLLPHQPLLRLLPAVADTHWLLFLVLGLEGGNPQGEGRGAGSWRVCVCVCQGLSSEGVDRGHQGTRGFQAGV